MHLTNWDALLLFTDKCWRPRPIFNQISSSDSAVKHSLRYPINRFADSLTFAVPRVQSSTIILSLLLRAGQRFLMKLLHFGIIAPVNMSESPALTPYRLRNGRVSRTSIELLWCASSEGLLVQRMWRSPFREHRHVPTGTQGWINVYTMVYTGYRQMVNSWLLTVRKVVLL